MILYHGSREVVKSPEIRILRYSKGFYARFSVIFLDDSYFSYYTVSIMERNSAAASDIFFFTAVSQ